MNHDNKTVYVKQYPRGYNYGFEIRGGIAPSITTSTWQNNNFVVIADETD